MENSTNGAIVKSGFALVRGVTAIMDEDSTIIFEKADSLDRIDRVVLRHDDTLSVRNTSIIILKGTPASTPQPPEITRDSTIWDLVLANVRIRANTNVVTQSQIEDTRLDTSICGIIASTIDTIDTETLYAQIQSDLIQFKENEQADFLEWFNEIKGQLSEDQAGHLQNQIDEIKEQGIMVADTLPIGSVIHWDSEEPYPTDIYEEVNYNPRQLLINNDFQVNQRGETEYIQDVNTPKYYIDMWKLYTEINTTAKITKLKKGIKIESTGGESQLFQIIPSTNENVACSIKINSISGNVDFAIYNDSDGWINKVTNLKVGVSSFVAEGKKTKRVGIRCHGTCVLEIEYIDLFEGDIAYPHVKKKYSEDLMECRRYLRKAWIKYLVRFNATNKFECFDTNILRGMVNTPTVIKDNLAIINLYFKSDYITLRKDEITIYPNNGILEIGATVSNDKIVDSCGTLSSNGYILITCEPL